MDKLYLWDAFNYRPLISPISTAVFWNLYIQLKPILNTFIKCPVQKCIKASQSLSGQLETLNKLLEGKCNSLETSS